MCLVQCLHVCMCVCVCGRGAAHVRVCTQCACAMCVHVHVYVGKSGCTHVCMCVEALEGVYQRRREIFQKGFPHTSTWNALL